MSTSDVSSTDRRQLIDALKKKAEQEYADFLTDAPDAGLTPAELDHRVARIMKRFDSLQPTDESTPPLPASPGWSTTQLVAGLARELIARIAPDELVLFAVTSQVFFANPQAVLRPAINRAAAFGISDHLETLTPAALYVTSEVIEALGSEPDSTRIKAALSRRLDPTSTGTQVPLTLPDKTLDRVRTTVMDSARKVGLPEPKAQQFAELIIKRLAVA